jgi:hypothetical protein
VLDRFCLLKRAPAAQPPAVLPWMTSPLTPGQPPSGGGSKDASLGATLGTMEAARRRRVFDALRSVDPMLAHRVSTDRLPSESDYNTP